MTTQTPWVPIGSSLRDSLYGPLAGLMIWSPLDASLGGSLGILLLDSLWGLLRNPLGESFQVALGNRLEDSLEETGHDE